MVFSVLIFDILCKAGVNIYFFRNVGSNSPEQLVALVACVGGSSAHCQVWVRQGQAGVHGYLWVSALGDWNNTDKISAFHTASSFKICVPSGSDDMRLQFRCFCSDSCRLGCNAPAAVLVTTGITGGKQGLLLPLRG